MGQVASTKEVTVLALRPIGQNDYNVIEDGERIGRIRYATERTPGVWLWNVQVHIPGIKPMGTARDLPTAKADFKAAWEAFKELHTSAEFIAAFRAMHIRDGD
jgi:hypothetical protein